MYKKLFLTRLSAITIWLLGAIFGALLFIIPALIFSNFDRYMEDKLRWLTFMSLYIAGASGPFYLVCTFGIMTFAIRQWARPLYAALEVFFGAYIGCVAMYLLYIPELLRPEFQALSSNSTYPLYVGLASAIFVIVRGLDNWTSFFKQKSGRT